MEYLPTPALLGFMTYAYAVNLFTFAVLGYARAPPATACSVGRPRCCSPPVSHR